MRNIGALLLVPLLALSSLAAAEGDGVASAMRKGADSKQVLAMINGGADVNAPDKKTGRTPLMVAVAQNYPEAARLLLDKGADVNAVAPKGLTVLIAAAMGGHPELVKLALDHGAKLEAADEDGLTALIYAAITTMPEVTAGIQGPVATPEERMSTLRLLLDRGADTNKMLPGGVNVLLMMCKSGKPEVIALLLDHGAKIDAQGVENTSPLMLAALTGNTGAVRLLLKRGANRKLKSSEGKTALDYAREERNAEIVKLLES